MTRGDGVIPSPNIWDHPATYELENLAFDPDGLVEATMRSHADWSGRDLLDIGCGTGFHLPRFAATARSVTGVEPHRPLVRLAARRTRRLRNVTVRAGSATALPLAPASVDVAHARWAYFLGPGCQPGLVELERVVRRGGTAFVIDIDATRSTFGRWFRAGYPTVDPVAVEGFWSSRGWSREPVLTRWRFERRADLEAVVRIEFDPVTAGAILEERHGLGPQQALEVDYAVNLWHRTY